MFELCIYWVYDASPSWYLIFVDWREKTTYVGFFFIGGHLCRGFSIWFLARSYFLWRGRIFYSKFFFNWKTLVPRTIDTEVVNVYNWQYKSTKQINLRNIYYCHVDRDASLSVGKLFLHHHKSDLAHTSDLYSLVIGMYKSEIWAKNNWKTND